MEDSNEDDFEESKIDIKLEEPDVNDMVVHDSFDNSEDSIGTIKQKSEENVSSKDTNITKPTMSLKMEYSNEGAFQETKHDIILEEIKLEDMDMPDYIDIREDIVTEINQEKLLIKSEDEDPCEENTNHEKRKFDFKPYLRSASKSEVDSTIMTKLGCSEYDLKTRQDTHRKKQRKNVHLLSCGECDYQTYHKALLQSHKLRHKSASEVDMFSCGKCDYETKYKSGLSSHMLRHKSATEIEMFSCGECDYQTKYKQALKPHKIRHKSARDIDMFSCGLCDYQAKVKGDLKQHMLVHKTATEIKMFSCGECGFQTKHKQHLKIHSLRHKRATEIEMFSCEECDFQTMYKNYLKKHAMRHKSASEIEMFHCERCGYQTKFHHNLRKHKCKSK